MLGVGIVFPVFKAETTIRPPGAVADFLSKCIRCGKCVAACPFDSIRLLGATAGKKIFTPYIDPIKTPCYLCRTKGPDGKSKPLSGFLRCGEVCPTGALTRIVNKLEVLADLPEKMKLGTASINRKLCIAWQFNFCGECYLNCPLKDKAIFSRPPKEAISRDGILPYVDQKACTGCGRCVFVCPVRVSDKTNTNFHDTQDYFHQRYGALVRRILDRSGDNQDFPAIRVSASI